MKRAEFLVLLLSVVGSVTAEELHTIEELDTPNYRVKIESACEEGNVTCDKVTYTGTSKKSGNSITVSGSTLHSLCADGVTPCRFLGYQFKNGNITYHVSADGQLEVIRNGKETLVNEQGSWQ